MIINFGSYALMLIQPWSRKA